jgi:hypothetical protein
MEKKCVYLSDKDIEFDVDANLFSKSELRIFLKRNTIERYLSYNLKRNIGKGELCVKIWNNEYKFPISVDYEKMEIFLEPKKVITVNYSELPKTVGYKVTVEDNFPVKCKYYIFEGSCCFIDETPFPI